MELNFFPDHPLDPATNFTRSIRLKDLCNFVARGIFRSIQWPRNDRKNGLRRNENVSKRAIIIFRNTRDYIQECVRGILGYWYSSNNNKLCSFIYIYIYFIYYYYFENICEISKAKETYFDFI